MEYGLQLFSIRDITEKDLKMALHEVSKIGYQFVEFAGFFDHTAEQINELMKRYKLNLSGTHTGVNGFAEHFDEIVAYHKAIGNRDIIIPAADLNTAEQIDDFVALVNEIQPKLQAEGIRLHYHNHDFEFKANEDGSVAYDEIEQRTKLFLEIDTFWVYAAKRDPLELILRLQDRVRLIHLKDGFEDGTGMPLGQGTAPVWEVWKLAKTLHIPMVVESETLNPDGITEARVCFDYLKTLEEKA